MKRSLSNVIRSVLVVLVVSTVLMCIFWMPEMVKYAISFLICSDCIQYLLYSICIIIAVTIITVFVLAFKFPSAIETDSIFTQKTAKLIKTISIIIFCDCALFGVGVIWLFAIGERLISPALAFVDIIGFTVAFMLMILSDYVKRAAVLKEEADYTL